MRFEHTNSYPAPPAEVLAMLTSEDFRDAVCVAQHALEHSVEIAEGAAGSTVRIRRRQSMDGAPSIARKVTGDSVEIVQEERWTSPVGADFSMAIPGKPGHLGGSIALVVTATGTDEVFAGEVKVNIPLVGGRLEKLIGDILRRALRREGRTGTSWLTDD